MSIFGVLFISGLKLNDGSLSALLRTILLLIVLWASSHLLVLLLLGVSSRDSRDSRGYLYINPDSHRFVAVFISVLLLIVIL